MLLRRLLGAQTSNMSLTDMECEGSGGEAFCAVRASSCHTIHCCANRDDQPQSAKGTHSGAAARAGRLRLVLLGSEDLLV